MAICKPDLENTGLSLKDVKHYIELYGQGDSTLPERYEIMRKQKEKTIQEMEELKLTKDMLNAHPGLTRIHITVEEA